MNTIDVCTDCYMAHHFGRTWREDAQREPTAQERHDRLHGHILEPPSGRFVETEDFGLIVEGLWYAGESDEPCRSEPLARVLNLDLADPYNGEENPHFSWLSCDGCYSRLGGARHPLTWTNPLEEQ